MRTMNKVFSDIGRIGGFMEHRLLDIPASRLIDFLPFMKKSCKEDMKILNRWENFFTDLKVPYIITKQGDKVTLWKKEVMSWDDVAVPPAQPECPDECDGWESNKRRSFLLRGSYCPWCGEMLD